MGNGNTDLSTKAFLVLNDSVYLFFDQYIIKYEYFSFDDSVNLKLPAVKDYPMKKDKSLEGVDNVKGIYQDEKSNIIVLEVINDELNFFTRICKIVLIVLKFILKETKFHIYSSSWTKISTTDSYKNLEDIPDVKRIVEYIINTIKMKSPSAKPSLTKINKMYLVRSRSHVSGKYLFCFCKCIDIDYSVMNKLIN